MAIFAILDFSHTHYDNNQVNGVVFIKLIDPATGAFTNGNNVLIRYKQIINGVENTYEVTISGQSKAIFTGLIADNNPGANYSAQFIILNVSEPSGPPPPVIVNTCDLKIRHVTPDRSESAIGAADAQITITATSSNGPITYSIDGENYQTSPVFSGMSGGSHTVFARDGDGCVAQSSVDIPVLTNLLIQDPSVQLPGGNISRWSAAFNPVVFTYQRKDFEVTAITLDTVSGNAMVTVNAGVSAVVEGDLVYLNAGAYNGTYKVTGNSGGRLILQTPFAGNATGFININRLRPYYKMLTRITYVDKLTGRQGSIVSTNRPNDKGLVRADISNFLQSLLRAHDDSDYTQVNFRDDNLSASYQVAYAEEWDEGGITKRSEYNSIATPFYVVYAAKQLGERFGGNLAAYVPFCSYPAGAEKAKWLSDFAEPAYSNGYPFDIGFIYSEHLLGRQLYCEFTLLDINRQPVVGETETTALLNEDGTWLLNNEDSTYVIQKQTSGAVPVPEKLGLNRLLIDQTFNPDVYYINIALKYNEGGTAHTVTQTQTIRVDDAVDDQSVYLRWIGLTGTWNYYRFVFNQEVSLDVQNAVIIKNYVYDWENQQGIEEVISKTAGQKVKVVAEDLSVADIKGLQSIKYSPKVQMLVNKNPVKWQTIIINTATYAEYETRNGRAPFSVTFNMPAVNIQSQ